MHVLSLALDSKVLDPESVVVFRSRHYGQMLEHYSIVVPSPETMVIHLSDRTTAYGVGGSSKALKLFRVFRVASRLIHTKKCDVITAQDMYFLGLLGLFLARRHHLGLEVQVLGIEKLTWFRKRLAIFVLKRASIVRALSPRIHDRLITEFGTPEERIRIVPIYVDVNKLGLDVRTLGKEDAATFEKAVQKFREQYGKQFNFLTVSRLVPIKRIELQLLALKNLLPEFPNSMLHIVGEGPHRDTLIEQVRALNLDEHVVFHGYQTGYMLGLFYLECDCFLLTSDYEGWGMVINEAASAGLPIIMTDVGCAGELVIHEKSGLVVPPKDVERLTAAMRRIITDTQLREHISVGATRSLAELPTFDTLLEQYKQNWERALERAL